MLEILSFTLGPVTTNAYLVADSETGDAAVIDPAWDGRVILDAARQRGWRIANLWYTHAHFDHIGGAAAIADALDPAPLAALHPADYVLWRAGGGGPMFGFNIDPGPDPAIGLEHGQILRLGDTQFQVRHTPGHTPGHCVFYCAEANALFSGDLIFYRSVGRTDLPGGNWSALERSIREQVYTLPDETVILSGHGSQTSVGDEKRMNPFIEV
ncbi:MAG: MBL fold metallo-hydrolase [Chloroflexi bacterium]|nr:MBL fold metallo-hydrolase [Chloroflexota bacterium]